MESGSGVAGLGMVPGYGDGWVYREGYTGVLPSQLPREEDPPDSEAGPGRPLQGDGSGWSGGSGRVTRGTVRTTLRARSVRPRPPLPVLPLQCRLWANKGEIPSIF